MSSEESEHSYVDSHSDNYRLNNIADSSGIYSRHSCSDSESEEWYGMEKQNLDGRLINRKIRRERAAELRKPDPYPFTIKTPMTYIRRKEFQNFDLTVFQNSHEEKQ